jgi:hypothetical protein
VPYLFTGTSLPAAREISAEKGDCSNPMHWEKVISFCETGSEKAMLGAERLAGTKQWTSSCSPTFLILKK